MDPESFAKSKAYLAANGWKYLNLTFEEDEKAQNNPGCCSVLKANSFDGGYTALVVD